MERELGVGPVELAQTHRLLLAKCLLTDTRLPVTRVAFASGFQSLRRFNSVFQQRYRMSPTALRQRPAALAPELPEGSPGNWIRLTLGYRPPLAWEALITMVAGDTPPGVGVVDGSRYGRTVALGTSRGVIFLEPAEGPQINVDLSVSLLPALMPLLARLRHLLDLDAEPQVIDAHLTEGGLTELVAAWAGLRLPGAFDGFEVATRELLGTELLGRVSRKLGDPIDTGIAFLDRLAPSAERVAEAGGLYLSGLGLPRPQAEALAALAQAVARGALRLEPGLDVPSTLRVLGEIPGVDERTATAIVMRALHWPDAFASSDPSLQRAAGVTNAGALLRVAEQWRPWRGYAAAHLWAAESWELGASPPLRYGSG
jgi:AraC family transcriptional regulator of adaptative response / DNA-3-methyladenine glycosylase II